MTQTIKVYDAPTRIFHWLFAALFLGAFIIAKVFDDDAPIYPYHMMLGMTLSVAVFLRLVWGLMGSSYARFSSFALHPLELLAYFKEILTPGGRRWAGHNPASSWAALAMMAMGLGLGATGFMMARDINKEFFEEIHELLANGFMVVAASHVAGVIFHTIRHKDPIGLSMLHGRKQGISHAAGVADAPTHGIFAVVMIAVVATFATSVFSAYDPATGRLSLLGTTLQLGESESGGGVNGEVDQESDGEDDGNALTPDNREGDEEGHDD